MTALPELLPDWTCRECGRPCARVVGADGWESACCGGWADAVERPRGAVPLAAEVAATFGRWMEGLSDG